MLEMIVLGLTVVVAQTVVGLITFKLCMSKAFIKKFTKKYMSMVEEVTEELLDEE